MKLNKKYTKIDENFQGMYKFFMAPSYHVFQFISSKEIKNKKDKKIFIFKFKSFDDRVDGTHTLTITFGTKTPVFTEDELRTAIYDYIVEEQGYEE